MKKKTNKLAVHLTDKEQIWGVLYLLFSVLLLPSLLVWLNSLLPTPLASAWVNFLYFTCNFLFVFWIFHGFFKRSLIYAGKNFWNFFVAVLVGFAAYWLASWLLSLALRHLFPAYTNLNDSSILSMAHHHFVIMFLGTVVLVPVAEEALHRGLIFGSLYPKSHWAAYVISVTVFAVVHIAGYVGRYSYADLLIAFVQYLPGGLSLAWAYRKSGSIFAPMLIHAVINAIGLLSMR